jgi:cytochrome c-type biogenesis protein CcmH/NrfF
MRLLAALLPLVALAQTPEQHARIENLENKLLAPCCYGEAVAHHQSQVAVQMRAEIRDWVMQGRTDREILDTYKARYGARVLIEPEGALWWWVHVIPGVALVLGLGFAVWFLRRMRARPSPGPAGYGPEIPEFDDD